MKKILLFAFAVLFMTSCNKTTVVSVEEFATKAGDLVDQTVIVEGVAKHICSNSGRKLFLSTPGKEQLVTVFTGEGMDPFDRTTTGKTYKITGKVAITVTIDEAYLNEWEQEVRESGLKEGTHICETEQQAAGIDLKENLDENPQMQQIKAYREKIAQNGGKPIVQYHIECSEFEVVE